MTNFIGIYDNIMSEKSCNKIIDFFEESEYKHPGRLYKLNTLDHIEIDKKAKDSTDLYCSLYENECKDILFALDKTTKEYIKDFPESNDGPSAWCLEERFNLQRYLPNQGYFSCHCENGNLDTSHRILAWMVYLNNVDDGGETRFPSYDLNVKPRTGRVVIWPAFFTHMHHGITSKTETKYIATGWYVYRI